MGSNTGSRLLTAAVVGAIALSAVACGSALPDYDYSAEPDPREREFVLGISDKLRIDVWKNSALSTEAVIRPDGTITMPLIGNLAAAGKTPTQLKESIERHLSRYVRIDGLEITVAVTEVNSYRFTVTGEVGQPGIYTANQYVTVAEAIAMAGGFTRYAETDSIVLLRRDNGSGSVRRIPIVYNAIATGTRPEMNLVILAGDSVFVP